MLRPNGADDSLRTDLSGIHDGLRAVQLGVIKLSPLHDVSYFRCPLPDKNADAPREAGVNSGGTFRSDAARTALMEDEADVLRSERERSIHCAGVRLSTHFQKGEVFIHGGVVAISASDWETS